MGRKRKLRYAILAGVVVAALAAALRPRPVRVEKAAVTRGPLTVTVDEEGRTRVRERFVVAAPVAGRLQRIGLHEGDAVEAGDVIARLAPAPLDSRLVGQGEARLRAAEAAREAASGARGAGPRRLRPGPPRPGPRRRAGPRGTAVARGARARDPGRGHGGGGAGRRSPRRAGRRLRGRGSAGRPPVRHPGRDGARRASCAVRSPEKGTVLRVLQESDRVVAAGTPLFELGRPGRASRSWPSSCPPTPST